MVEGDLELVLGWRNHPDVRRYMLTQHEISMDEHRSWFRSTLLNGDKQLLIFEIDNLPYGFVQFSGLASGKVADWGFYLAPNARQGTGQSLGLAALDYGFGLLNLHKVCGQALEFNKPSIKFHLRLGFQQEGLLRDQHFDGRNYHSMVCFGLLAEEWSNRLKDI
ncbi:UDP-4-amino-4,6-dideoxy-N-acetyl-beta-L-altrosamine N-acetyltransferase [Pusillimonas sp. SM2304]|uniref:UDP-4-amino-4, 6-dideoxy-N-acetyl-beta-L-altrosamine N-acetyltransferase n=1 Tax=Pusillimonas sp. SM2304 TaxID=3073241 RepID=UPI00287701B6|nr:UDP-4-amino-4,6-dideoxy-N-acetyl-beta-L-altrosamine N-acetyltransferase [Pusillimonas sp. SM2304]MDS1140035.1 UDP-4-amino-4,6-dideoxy-N-acetyl-beta-L-altrosamine N-acetyltransferase [Pusillimonas sp. SM2304]